MVPARAGPPGARRRHRRPTQSSVQPAGQLAPSAMDRENARALLRDTRRIYDHYWSRFFMLDRMSNNRLRFQLTYDDCVQLSQDAPSGAGP
jgi:hypothetical protein